MVHNKLVKELIKNFKSCGYSITSVRQIGISSCYLIRPNEYKGTPLRTLLRKNNLLNNKHIPKDYIYNSVENRRELIRGLCDSDGSIDKKGRSKFAQKNYKYNE